MILDEFPHVVKGSFKPQYDKIKYPGGNKEFKAWSNGQTGFPIVDAAMRCLNQTGMMHNRLRMVVASFLCKTLLVDWRKGEHYFAEKLLDYDLAANNGGWQWSSSSGVDAQPYFRIFNPYNQSEKFDPDGEFIRTWVPEVTHLSAKEIHRPDSDSAPDYVRPIVSYELNRHKCLTLYSVVKNYDSHSQIRQKKPVIR
jgi:deoxyribodipyrimidine photo-lyase